MTYTYLQQLEDAHYYGYETAKQSNADRLIELLVRLSNCSANQRVATFESYMCSQCDVELNDVHIFDCFRDGILVLIDELKLALSGQLDYSIDYYDWRQQTLPPRLKFPPGKTRLSK